MYIRDVSASVARPVRELKGFQRVTLNPYEKKNVDFSIDSEMLKFTHVDNAISWEPGEFTLWIGNNSQTDNSATFFLDD